MLVDKETKKFNLIPVFSYKVSWNFNKKEECNNIIRNWQIISQTLDKGNHFIELLDDNFNIIIPIYTEGSSWIIYFGHLNFLYIRATRAIINHAPIGEYHLRFFPRENFSCLYRSYPIQSR